MSLLSTSHNMIRCCILIVFLHVAAFGFSQSDYSYFTKSLNSLYSFETVARQRLWDSLASAGRIPLIAHDSVAFLYRGEAQTVKWTGDFNGWEYDKSFNNNGTRIPGTDIWILKAAFPKDARLDYKLIVDKQWILDPENKYQQLSGVGGGSPNSELRMPEWKPDPVTRADPSVPTGTLKEDILFTSKVMGYQLTYSLYVPHSFNDKEHTYPVLYVTDGYEYLHPQMGSMKTILDNLIAAGKICPIIVVFVDNRDPINRSSNRRMQELALNDKYLQFFTTELIPRIEENLNLKTTATSRGILGTSMGGLTAAYFAFSRPDVFGLAGIQSPAFWFRPEIYTVCENAEAPSVKVYLTTGLIHDTREGVEKMKNILEKNTCTFKYKEVNQGHSWGQWKDLIDDVLIYFYALK
jgi:enterochelin esterase-like enzyme